MAMRRLSHHDISLIHSSSLFSFITTTCSLNTERSPSSQTSKTIENPSLCKSIAQAIKSTTAPSKESQKHQHGKRVKRQDKSCQYTQREGEHSPPQKQQKLTPGPPLTAAKATARRKETRGLLQQSAPLLLLTSPPVCVFLLGVACFSLWLTERWSINLQSRGRGGSHTNLWSEIFLPGSLCRQKKKVCVRLCAILNEWEIILWCCAWMAQTEQQAGDEGERERERKKRRVGLGAGRVWGPGFVQFEDYILE